MTDIDQKKDCAELLRAMQIPLDQFAPLLFFTLRHFRVTVARKIHKIHRFIYIIEINGLRLARLRTRARQRFTVHQTVNQGRFSDVRFSGKCNLRLLIFRKHTRDTTYRFQIYLLDNHLSAPLVYFTIPPVIHFRTEISTFCCSCHNFSTHSLPSQ